MKETIVYWVRCFEVSAIIAAIVILCVWGRNPPAFVLPTLFGLLTAALAAGRSPVNNAASTVVRTVRPPPLPPPDESPPP